MASATEVEACLNEPVTVLGHSGLESDATLATEVLPGPPPLLTVQHSFQKRDLKKPVYSYLPATDPGTSYCGSAHGTTSQPDPSSDLLRDKGTGRGQRASARNHNGQSTVVTNQQPASSASSPVPMTASHEMDGLSSTRRRTSRSVSVQIPAVSAPANVGGRPRRIDKGKGKEVIRIKVEPRIPSLLQPSAPHENDEFCSACTSPGRLANCDGCPKSFHLWCLDPPLPDVDEKDESEWFCPCCKIQQEPPPKPPASLGILQPFIHQLLLSPPREFQLPLEIREHFKDVATGARGTYLDISDVKHYRPNKFGQVEPRDPHRLRDRNGDAILCFRCGTSAMPSTAPVAGPSTPPLGNTPTDPPGESDVWKSMISCDYCDLHWHLDCLDPPRLTMPSASKKFMCPNHSERVKPSKHRIPKANSNPITIKKPGAFNSGNIEIINPIIPRSVDTGHHDDTTKYGRKFRVPEKVILLDFWAKVSGPDRSSSPPQSDDDSALSSPLTSLSSLEDEVLALPGPVPSHEDIELALLLCGLAGLPAPSGYITGTSSPSPSAVTNGPSQRDPTTPPGSSRHASVSFLHTPQPYDGWESSVPDAKHLEHDTPFNGNGPSSKSSPRRVQITRASTNGNILEQDGSHLPSSRKRKARDDDAMDLSDHGRPAAISQANLSNILSASSRPPRSGRSTRAPSASQSAPPTPSLKIRLPALNTLGNSRASSSQISAVPPMNGVVSTR